MSKVLNDYTVIVNALYAKQTDYLNYADIKEYKKLLYKMLSKEFKYILFETTLPDIFEIDDHMFIKLKDGIQSIDELDEEFIKKTNSIYSEEYQEIINISREKYTDVKAKVKKHS